MRLIRKGIKNVFIAIVFTTCIEPFYPPVGDFSDLLVVEGVITDQPESQVIKLSRTFRLDTIMVIPETNATVELISEEETFKLRETEPGVYETNPFQFKGEVGCSYQLSFTTTDGNQYLSEPVMLKYVPPIDSVHWRWEEKQTLEEYGNLEGVQWYVSTHDPTDQTNYYRWDWEETYEFYAEFESLSKWNSKRRIAVPRLLPEEQIYRCWNTVQNREVIIYSAERLSTSLVRNFPFHFVSNRTRRLQRRYSIILKQYTLSAEGYRYWQDLKTISENTGSIFDVQPFKVQGNISNINNKDENVLGYFDASAVQEQRIFISRFDDFNYLSIYNSCEKFYGGRRDYSYVLLQKGDYIVLDHDDKSPTHISYTWRWCGNCTVEGVTKKPDFW